MSAKKRRRSNWYIYIVTFIITGVLLGFVVYQLRDYLFVKEDAIQAIGNSDFRPEASQNMTVLCMVGEMKGSVPGEFMIVNYRPRDGVVMLIPLTQKLYSTVGGFAGNLVEQYQNGGAKGVMYAVETATGVTCDYYIKFDSDSFAETMGIFGNTEVSIPYDLKDDEDKTVYTAGKIDLTGDGLFRYITFPNLSDDDEYKCVLQASAISACINQNISSLTVSDVSSMYKKILSSSDTNLTESVFTSHLDSIYFTIANNYDPALFYVPYGEYDEDKTVFTVSAECKEKIRDRLGLVE